MKQSELKKLIKSILKEQTGRPNTSRPAHAMDAEGLNREFGIDRIINTGGPVPEPRKIKAFLGALAHIATGRCNAWCNCDCPGEDGGDGMVIQNNPGPTRFR